MVAVDVVTLVVAVGSGDMVSNRKIRVETGQKVVNSYGMELPRVGAFTEKWGSGYRKPVQILG